MLRELHIQNLAVIQDITVELHPGLNCFTGQTGAGKSLVIGALEILLGLRQPVDMLRKGAGEGRVTGVFHIESEGLREQLAGATDLPLEQEPELIIARRIFEATGRPGSGRTSASINGHPITGAMLKQVGEILVDVHGQHDAQYLLKPANQLAVIDEFGSGIVGVAGGGNGAAGLKGRPQRGCVELRREFAELFHRRQELLAQEKELTASRTLRRQQLELYEFQAHEMDEAQLISGEHAELSARGKLLANLEKIKRTAGIAYGVLYEEEASIVERVKGTMVVLLELAELDESLAPIAQQIRETAVNLDDAAFSLRRYIDRLDLDPAELAQVHERLNLLNRLINKYAGHGGRGAAAGAHADAVEEVIAYRGQIGRQIEELRTQDRDYSTIGEQIAELEGQLKKVGAELSAQRRKAAERLLPLVHRQLADLGMKEARFLMEFQPLQMGLGENSKLKTQNAKPGPKPEMAKAAGGDSESLASVMAAGIGGGDVLKVGVQDFSLASGMETVEFLIAPNPGQPARPLRRIASGGELSRIMLALKGILAQKDRVSVLVFDEIDANVGGRMGSVIGEKLRTLAGVHQVLCITHLPQIAAFADRHLTIRKQIAGSADAGQTHTTVAMMEGEARVRELAEMTAGPAASNTALAQARELLAAAGSPPKRAAAKGKKVAKT